jgi:glycosyltransferase involved in cell wall biosynthesis
MRCGCAYAPLVHDASEISVGALVPVHGPAPFLGEALEAVLSQHPAPAVVVVVDDGSPEPVALDAAHAARCRLVRREQRGGAPAARDAGLELLETDWVALADADDAWRPGKLKAQLEALAAHPRAAVCAGRAVVVDARGRPTGEHWEELPAGAQDLAALAALLYERNPIPTSSVVLRRSELQTAGGFAGPAPAEDWDLWLRLVERGAVFVHEPRAQIAYRRHPDQLSANIAALAEATLAVHAAHGDLVDEPTRRRVRASDLRALARGRVRQRRYADARAALAEAAALAPQAPRERALRALLAVPGLRAALGRRAPYPN